MLIFGHSSYGILLQICSKPKVQPLSTGPLPFAGTDSRRLDKIKRCKLTCQTRLPQLSHSNSRNQSQCENPATASFAACNHYHRNVTYSWSSVYEFASVCYKSVLTYYKCASKILRNTSQEHIYLYKLSENMSKVETQHYLSLLGTGPVDNESLSFFSNHPCGLPYLTDPSPYQPVPFTPHYEKNDTSDTFFNQTLNTAGTIPHALALIRRDILELNPRLQERESDSAPPLEPDFVLLVKIDTCLNGFQGTVHGGLLASLLDESLGCCVEALSSCLDLVHQRHPGERTRLYTANLNISYRAPVTSPGVVTIRTWLKRREGRKWFLEGTLSGDDGRVRTEVKGLWISERSKTVL